MIPSAGKTKGQNEAAFAVAIDGPAGAGKSTVASALGERLGFFLLDTGAIYRTLAWAAVQNGVGFDDATTLAALAAALPITFTPGGGVLLGDADVTAAIRTPEMSQAASTVSAYAEVRAALLELQRRLARTGSCVVEGRDIGTVVLPWAQAKFFLTASPEVRARRRFDELTKKGATVTFEATLKELNERDARDSSREAAPLKQAADAILVDSTNLSFDDVLAFMQKRVAQLR